MLTGCNPPQESKKHKKDKHRKESRKHDSSSGQLRQQHHQQQQLTWLCCPPPRRGSPLSLPDTVQNPPSCVLMPPACHARPATPDSEGPSGPEDAWLQQQAGGSDGDEPGSPAGSKPSQAAAAALEREDWMTVPMARPFAGQPDDKQQQQKEKEEVRGLHVSREASGFLSPVSLNSTRASGFERQQQQE